MRRSSHRRTQNGKFRKSRSDKGHRVNRTPRRKKA